MAKHPKTGITLLYTQTQWFTYLPISVVNVKGNGETLYPGPNITRYHQWENMMLSQGRGGAYVPLGPCTWRFTPDPILFWFCFACKLVTGTFCRFLVKYTLGCSQIERVEGHKEGYEAAEVKATQNWILHSTVMNVYDYKSESLKRLRHHFKRPGNIITFQK